MKILSVAEAQHELPRLIQEQEPLVLTQGSNPIAIIVHLDSSPSELEVTGRKVSGLRLQDVVSDKSIRAFIVQSGNDVYVVSAWEKPGVSTAEPAKKRDWWTALTRIEEEQKRRGFVGSESDMDRGDEGYEERMSSIYKNTLPKNGKS